MDAKFSWKQGNNSFHKERERAVEERYVDVSRQPSMTVTTTGQWAGWNGAGKGEACLLLFMLRSVPVQLIWFSSRGCCQTWTIPLWLIFVCIVLMEFAFHFATHTHTHTFMCIETLTISLNTLAQNALFRYVYIYICSMYVNTHICIIISGLLMYLRK